MPYHDADGVGLHTTENRQSTKCGGATTSGGGSATAISGGGMPDRLQNAVPGSGPFRLNLTTGIITARSYAKESSYQLSLATRSAVLQGKLSVRQSVCDVEVS